MIAHDQERLDRLEQWSQKLLAEIDNLLERPSNINNIHVLTSLIREQEVIERYIKSLISITLGV